jgi:hypothetical protein
MDDTAVQRALDRIAVSRESRADPVALEAVLIRARAQVESLAASTAVMQVGLPGAIQDGLREHFKPSARHLAEVRGLMNQMLRRMERLETDLLAERNARIDDLALLVDLIASSWRSANERLERIEAAVEPKAGNSAVVYRIERNDQQAS